MANLDSIENIVRIMDFHALARIDKAKSSAEKAKETEQLLEKVIRQIQYNKNLNIDKKLITANERGVDLNIYIGSDLSFCGDFNSSIAKEINQDEKSDKIVVGQKIQKMSNQNFVLSISKEDFYRDSSQISQIIDRYLIEGKAKSISIIYNKYYSIDDIRLEKLQIFPVVLEKKSEDDYDTDFVIENDTNQILSSIIAVYLNFRVQIAEKSSWAAENVNRERTARESMKRIEELKEEAKVRRNQEKRHIELKEQIAVFERLKWRHS